MESFAAMLLPTCLGLAVLGLIRRPLGWLMRSSLRAVSGFLCLWSLNTVSGFTGLTLPINPITVFLSALLGLPGVALVSLAELFL